MPITQPACPVCQSPKRRLVGARHRWNDTDWHLVRCGGCGHRYTDLLPDDAEIARMYGDGYFEEGGAWVCGYWAGSYVENEVALRREAGLVLGQLGPANGRRLLEIGCAGGFFLDEARQAGFHVRGVELNAAQAAHAREMGLDAVGVPIESANLPAGVFDVVIAQDVLEHLRDLHGFCTHARALLAPHGTLVIRGPLEADTRTAIYDTLRRLRGQTRVIDEPPFHLQGFTPNSFRLLCERTGLAVQRLETTPHRMPLSRVTLRELAAQPIEWIGYLADRLRGGGMFMVGEAQRADQAMSSAA